MKRLSLALIAVLLLASPAAGQEDSPGRKDPLVLHPKGDATQGAIRPEQARAVAAVARALFAQGREAYLRGDYTEAVRLYRLAAEQGLATAQSILGDMNRDGQGVPQDFVTAHVWYNLSASRGFQTAASARADVARRMTPEQIAEAQRLAREWQAAFEGRQ